MATRRRETARRAVTLVELLVVIVVIGILLSAVLVAGGALIDKSRASNTQAVMTIVNEALLEFRREQKQRPTITKPHKPRQTESEDETYVDRYGLFPPDELEVFAPAGVPDVRYTNKFADSPVSLPAPFQPMDFFSKPADPMHEASEHRDNAAMVLAIEALGDVSRAILDRLPERNRSKGVFDDDPTNPKPVLFLDRDGDGNWGSEDLQIRFVLDDWGNPISYFAQRQSLSAIAPTAPSSNHPDWNDASKAFVRLNRGQPVLMSYGADGAEQLTAAAMGADADASLVEDFTSTTPQPLIVDNPFNADNVFLNQELKERIFQGLPQ